MPCTVTSGYSSRGPPGQESHNRGGDGDQQEHPPAEDRDEAAGVRVGVVPLGQVGPQRLDKHVAFLEREASSR